MAGVFELLTAARSADDATRNYAETQLRAAEAADFGGYLYALTGELADESRTPDIRQLAALMVKNALDAISEIVAADKHSRWMELASDGREAIKANIFSALASDQLKVQTSAAQALSKIAKIELPAKCWPDLITRLVTPAVDASLPDTLRAAALQAIGFICEELMEPDDLADEAPRILECIVGCMGDGNASAVQLAAVRALLNALDFADGCINAADPGPRDAIITAIGTRCTASDDPKVQEESFNCLVRFADFYYAALGPYMPQLAALTSEKAAQGDSVVATYAIEFWTCVAGEEDQLEEDAPENGHFTATYLEGLVGMLTTIMATHAKEVPTDDYTVEQAAANCLTQVAQLLGDAAVGPVLAFVTPAYDSANWKERDAATMAFGCILEGPSTDKMVPVINGALPHMLGRLIPDTDAYDACATVRESTAWTVARVVLLYGDDIDMGALFDKLVAAARAAVNDAEARVASKAAGIFCYLGELLEGHTQADGKTPLSDLLPTIVGELMTRADGDDWNENRLHTNCYDAISALVEASGTADLPFVQFLFTELGRRLTEAVAAMTTSGHSLTEAQRKQCESIMMACLTTLQAVISALGSSISEYAAAIMELSIEVLNSRIEQTTDEALRCIGCLANAVGDAFVVQLPVAMPVLLSALQQVSSAGTMEWALWSVSEVIAACADTEELKPYLDEVINHVLTAVGSKELARHVKPSALKVFGDIARAQGPTMSDDFINGCLEVMMKRALQTAPEKPTDEEDVEYVGKLRTAVLDGWSGVAQAFLPDDDAPPEVRKLVVDNQHRVRPYFPDIAHYLEEWTKMLAVRNRPIMESGKGEPTPEDVTMIKSMGGLLGDVANVCGREFSHIATQRTKWVKDLVAMLSWVEAATFSHDEDGGAEQTPLANYIKRVVPR